MDNVRSTASAAAQTVAQTLDPSSDGSTNQNYDANDAQESSTKKQTYQEQLKAAAHSSSSSNSQPEPPKKEESLMEKGTSTIPKLLDFLYVPRNTSMYRGYDKLISTKKRNRDKAEAEANSEQKLLHTSPE